MLSYCLALSLGLHTTAVCCCIVVVVVVGVSGTAGLSFTLVVAFVYLANVFK